MKLRFMEGVRTGRLVEIESSSFIIGRDIKCDLMLDEDGVSREHCKIIKEGDDYLIKDLGSTNGVYVNGKKIEEPTRINANDKLRIGKTLFLFTDATGVLDTAEVEKLQEAAKSQLAEKEAEEAKKRAETKKKDSKRKSDAEKKADTANKAVTAVFVIIMAILAVLLVFMLIAPTDDDKSNGDKPDNGLVQEDPLDPPDLPGGDDDDLAGDDDDDTAPLPGGDDDDDDVAGPVPGDDDDAADLPDVPVTRPKITYYWIRSDPPGAVAVVDGEDVGTTPVMVQGLERGTHKLKLVKDGYRELDRVFEVPFKDQFFDYKLDLEPGLCLITSEPTGMAVMRGPQIIGYTPFMFRGEVGNHDLRMIGAGYATLPFTARISLAGPTKQHLRMRALTSGLQVITVPAGARIFVDGVYLGQTAPKPRGESEPLVLTDLRPGTHKVYIEANGSQSRAKTVRLEKGMTSKVGLLIFEVDTVIATRDGKKLEGRFIHKKPDGDIVMALEGNKLITVKAANIQMLQPVTDAPAPEGAQ